MVYGIRDRTRKPDYSSFSMRTAMVTPKYHNARSADRMIKRQWATSNTRFPLQDSAFESRQQVTDVGRAFVSEKLNATNQNAILRSGAMQTGGSRIVCLDPSTGQHCRATLPMRSAPNWLQHKEAREQDVEFTSKRKQRSHHTLSDTTNPALDRQSLLHPLPTSNENRGPLLMNQYLAATRSADIRRPTTHILSDHAQLFEPPSRQGQRGTKPQQARVLSFSEPPTGPVSGVTRPPGPQVQLAAVQPIAQQAVPGNVTQRTRRFVEKARSTLWQIAQSLVMPVNAVAAPKNRQPSGSCLRLVEQYSQTPSPTDTLPPTTNRQPSGTYMRLVEQYSQTPSPTDTLPSTTNRQQEVARPLHTQPTSQLSNTTTRAQPLRPMDGSTPIVIDGALLVGTHAPSTTTVQPPGVRSFPANGGGVKDQGRLSGSGLLGIDILRFLGRTYLGVKQNSPDFSATTALVQTNTGQRGTHTSPPNRTVTSSDTSTRATSGYITGQRSLLPTAPPPCYNIPKCYTDHLEYDGHTTAGR